MTTSTVYSQGAIVAAAGINYLVVSNGTSGGSLANISGDTATNGTLFLRRCLMKDRRSLVICNRTTGILYLNPTGKIAQPEHGIAIDPNGSFSFSFKEEVPQYAISVWPTVAGLITGAEWLAP